VQPLIRYELGDSVAIDPDACPCGRPLPTVRVQGRTEEILHVPGPDGHEVALLPMALATVVEETPGVHRFQVVQTAPTTLAVRLRAGPGYRPDAVWDVVRAERIERQRALGLHAHLLPVPGRSPGVPAWNDVAAERRTLYARYMELYAAIVDNVDQNIGRLKDHLTRLGRLDNTLFIVTSDNGANGIGGVDGAVNNLAKRLTRTEDPDVVRRALDDGRLGAADTWPRIRSAGPTCRQHRSGCTRRRR